MTRTDYEEVNAPERLQTSSFGGPFLRPLPKLAAGETALFDRGTREFSGLLREVCNGSAKDQSDGGTASGAKQCNEVAAARQRVRLLTGT